MTRECYYVLPSVKPGDEISWSALEETREIRLYERDDKANPDVYRYAWVTYTGVRFTPIPYCTFGDYDNSTTTERSNARVMRERFPWLVRVIGSHGSEMLGYLGETENQNPELIEAIESLESYPIADESDESELTMQREHEAWQDHGLRDFAEFLADPLREWQARRCDLDEGDTVLSVILDREGEEYEHGITYATAAEIPMSDECKTLTEIWFTVLSEYGSGETSRQEGGGGFHFSCEDWYRTLVRAMGTRKARLDAYESACALDPQIVALVAQGRDGRAIACDRLRELEMPLAVEHVESMGWHPEDNLGKVLVKLAELADHWSESTAIHTAIVNAGSQ